ncbi:hypothetical protein IG631_20750 [Alternaria alternata]|nr:hypothetical protein IG631_20750 [Alternaria alternata]
MDTHSSPILPAVPSTQLVSPVVCVRAVSAVVEILEPQDHYIPTNSATPSDLRARPDTRSSYAIDSRRLQADMSRSCAFYSCLDTSIRDAGIE